MEAIAAAIFSMNQFLFSDYIALEPKDFPGKVFKESSNGQAVH